MEGPVPRAPRPAHRLHSGVQADAHRRRVLARQTSTTSNCSVFTAPHGNRRRRWTRTCIQLEEAEKRDHRRLGTELDLFSFPSEIGAGLAVWHPKGGLVRRVMEEYSRVRHEAAGYSFVTTPHWRRRRSSRPPGIFSGTPTACTRRMAMDNATYYMKPMNCPMHILIYKARGKSYRELPQRLFRVRHGLPVREVRRVARAHPHPRFHPGRQPHLLHARAVER